MRRAFTLCSIVVHTIVVTVVFGVQSLAVGELPTPHQPLLYDPAEFIPVDIKLPAPPRRAPGPPPDAHAVSSDAAPIVAPTGVAPEIERPAFTPAPIGSVDGVDGGVPLGSDAIGGTTAPPPPPPPPATRPIRLHSGIIPPRKIVDVAPVYPAIAQQARRDGIVILETVIDATGVVESVRVLRPVPLLDQAAVDAVRQWRFTPALLNGEAVPVVMTVTVNFTLRD
jgi:protein TonB